MAERSVRTKLPHGVPAWVAEGSVYFITVCARDRGGDVLTAGATPTLVRQAVEFQVKAGLWWVDLFLVMPDHIHALMAFGGGRPMVRSIALWKSYVAKQAGIRWQRDFFEHRIRERRSFGAKWTYIMENPVRRGLVPTADAWPWVWTAQDLFWGEGGGAVPARPEATPYRRPADRGTG